MKSFEEKLEEIINKELYASTTSHGQFIVLGIEQAKLAFLHLLDEEMPEEHDQDIYHDWNSYRTELLKRLGVEE